MRIEENLQTRKPTFVFGPIVSDVKFHYSDFKHNMHSYVEFAYVVAFVPLPEHDCVLCV